MTSLFGGGSSVNVNASGTLVPQVFHPTDGQTVFTLNAFSYTPNSNSLLIWINGVKQISGVDFQETSSATFTLTSPVTASDVIEIIGFPLATVNVLSGNVAGDISTTGNLTFTGLGKRITGDFSNSKVANRLLFQTSTVNGNTVVGAIPNGSGVASQFTAYGGIDTANTSTTVIQTDLASGSNFIADQLGSGSYLPMRFLVGGSERMRIDTAGDITYRSAGAALNNVASINGGQLAGLRNRIINGGMQVAQRSAPMLSGSYQYGQCDRWQFVCAGGTGISGNIAQNYFTSFDSGYSGGVLTASWTNGQFFAQQRIESKNVADFGGKTVTISAKVYQDTGGTRNFQIALRKATAGVDNWGTQADVGISASFPSATGAVTPISASFMLGASDHLNGLAVVIFDAATNTVVSKTYLIGDVQLEVGSVATTFEQRPYGQELQLCQRYYETIPSWQLSAYQLTGTNFGAQVFYKVTKRANPSSINGTPSYSNASGVAVANIDVQGFFLYAVATASGAVVLIYTSIKIDAEL